MTAKIWIPANSIGLPGMADSEFVRSWVNDFLQTMLEIGLNQTYKNAQEWATQVATTSAMALFDAYCAWHQAKGYWPHETPLGRVKES